MKTINQDPLSVYDYIIEIQEKNNNKLHKKIFNM